MQLILFICCIINHRICIQSYAVSRDSEVDIIYGVYVDIVKFLIHWVPLHYYDVSLLHQIYTTLTNGWLVYCTWGIVYYQLWCNKCRDSFFKSICNIGSPHKLIQCHIITFPGPILESKGMLVIFQKKGKKMLKKGKIFWKRAGDCMWLSHMINC